MTVHPDPVTSCNTWGVQGVQTLGVDKSKGRKAEGLRNEVAGLEAAVQAASQEYDRVKLRNTQVPYLMPDTMHLGPVAGQDNGACRSDS